MDKLNGTKQGRTLPWAGQTAPSKAVTLPWAGQTAPSKVVRYHGQVKWDQAWHQAGLYVTMGKSSGTRQGCTLPWAGRMAPNKAPLLTCNKEKTTLWNRYKQQAAEIKGKVVPVLD